MCARQQADRMGDHEPGFTPDDQACGGVDHSQKLR